MAGNYFSNDTITAIATSVAGDGGVGIIRISGPDALVASLQISRGLSNPEPRYLHRIEIVRDDQVIDDGLGVYFPKGQSFTGEECVELQLHGGRFLLQSVLNLLVSTKKCRLALPGEFSFRAVRNGKISLSGASAVAQIISAKSMFEVQAARKSFSTTRIKEFDAIASGILNLLAQTELSIDFIDQDVEVISANNMSLEITSLQDKVEKLLGQMRAAQRIARGIQVTLTGTPNAGKSTLFNALLAEDRAIVSPEAGTTRDVITEELRVGPYYIRLADTAGIREASGTVERQGVERATELAADSDLAILVIDGSLPLPQIETEIYQGLSSRSNVLLVINKWDLIRVADRAEKQNFIESVISSRPVKTLYISAASSINESAVGAPPMEGIQSLLDLIRQNLDSRFSAGLNSFLPTEFQIQMLLQCQENLISAQDLLSQSGLGFPELISASLRSAVQALSDLVGDTTPDTVLSKIFSEFCIGK